jgi:hypothetical protein
METSSVDEKKLEDLIEKAVQKHLKLTFEDVEEVRRSPAGGIIRLEGRLDAIEARLDRDMVTRAEFQEANGQINTRLEKLETQMVTRVEFKDEIWKLKLYILLLAALILLTNPTVLELFGKILGIIK